MNKAAISGSIVAFTSLDDPHGNMVVNVLKHVIEDKE